MLLQIYMDDVSVCIYPAARQLKEGNRISSQVMNRKLKCQCAYTNDMRSLNKSNDGLKSILHIVSKLLPQPICRSLDLPKYRSKSKSVLCMFAKLLMHNFRSRWISTHKIFNISMFRLRAELFSSACDFCHIFSLLLWWYRCWGWQQEDEFVVKCCRTFIIKTNCFIRLIVIMFTDEL